MATKENDAFVRTFFDDARARNMRLIKEFADDGEELLAEAALRFEEMMQGMAYMDAPDAPMATSVFSCQATLALWLALEARGVDVHDFGQAMLKDMTETAPPERRVAPGSEASTRAPRENFEALMAAGRASAAEVKPGEFVFEAYWGDRKELDWGMNIKSCAICHAFGKYNAMDLVPYMCATDDVMSDLNGEGLRRSGSIALGAEQCDFRYKHGGDPARLAKLYPEKIHFPHED